MGEVDVTKQSEDNSTIKEMRAKIDATNEENKALKAQLTEFERTQMDKETRLASERDEALAKAKEADALRAENGQYASKFQALFDNEIASVPVDKRPQVEAIVNKFATPHDKYEAVLQAKALMGVAPQVHGTITNPMPAPVIPPPPAAPTTYDPVEIAKNGLAAYLKPVSIGNKAPNA